MRWFKHDSNAYTDSKLKKVRQKYGMVGYGLYWYCVELIASNISRDNITFELEDDAETIAIDWNLDQLKVEEMMRFFVQIGLFESSKNTITCMKLAKRLDDTNSKNPEIRNIISKLDSSDKVRQIPNNSEEVGDSPKKSGQNRIDKIRLDNKHRKKITLDDYLYLCEKEKTDPIPEDSIVFKNAEKAGLDFEMVKVAWSQFKDNYLNDNKTKKYANWLLTFNKTVKENWYKLWWTDANGVVGWTSTGQQARKIYKDAA